MQERTVCEKINGHDMTYIRCNSPSDDKTTTQAKTNEMPNEKKTVQSITPTSEEANGKQQKCGKCFRNMYVRM